MRIVLTSTNFSQNNSHAQISHKGSYPILNRFNPISACADKYFNRMAVYSTDKFEVVSNLLETQIKKLFFKNISAWDINPVQSPNYILFLHGMAQNISNYQPLYKTIISKGKGVFALEYRGYGCNGISKISEKLLQEDVENGYKYLVEEKGINPENITLVGHSMGGALAAALAAKHPEIKNLILISPISQMVDLGNKFYLHKRLGLGVPPFIKKLTDYCKPLRWLYNQRFNSLKKIKNINAQIYYIQSNDDSVTTISGARKFAKVARKKGILNQFINLPTGGHKVDSRKVSEVSKILDLLNN